MKEIKAEVLQSWFDIAIQHTGSVMNTFALALVNGYSVTDEIEGGQVIMIPDILVTNVREVLYLKTKKAVPATGVTVGQTDSFGRLGIGTMIIETNFIVG